MPENFKCGVCFKAFKTNQHLTQHKNRKKKCYPPIHEPPIHDMDNYSIASSVTTTPLFHLPMQNCRYKHQTPRQNPLGEFSDDTENSIFDKQQDFNITSNVNNISQIKNTSTPALMDLFIKYKETLDENKKLETNILDLKSQLMNTNAENMLLKKKMEIVHKFIFSFQDFPCLKNITEITKIDEIKNNQ